jgi:hypothetical protein
MTESLDLPTASNELNTTAAEINTPKGAACEQWPENGAIHEASIRTPGKIPPRPAAQTAQPLRIRIRNLQGYYQVSQLAAL